MISNQLSALANAIASLTDIFSNFIILALICSYSLCSLFKKYVELYFAEKLKGEFESRLLWNLAEL